nr:YdaS family helix-turn-helix protein [Caballeronia sp. LZ001]
MVSVMEALRAYLNSKSPQEQAEFARRCNTTIGYLRKAISAKAEFDVQLCINIEEQSNGVVRCEDLRPTVRWSFLRNSSRCRPLESPAYRDCSVTEKWG